MSNRIEVNPYYIRITADYSDTDFLSLISQVECFKGRKRNEYFTSIRNLPEVMSILRRVESSDTLSPLIKYLYNEEMTRRVTVDELLTNGSDGMADDLKGLWPHQQLGVELADIMRRYAFFYDTRTGKTRMALTIMRRALKQGKAKRCIVICPSSIIQSWLADAKEYPDLRVVAYYGDLKQKIAAFQQPAHIYLWSMEQSVSTLGILKASKFDICFVDESSKLKSHKSQITNAMLELSECIPRWYLLSATPAPNNESEYYSQMRTIDKYIFHPARCHFVEKYFNNLSRNPAYEKLAIKPEMYKPFMDKVKQYAIYVDQSVMPTAGKEWVTHKYHMDEESCRLYNKMREDCYAEVEGITISADMAAAVRAKLNQIAAGFIMDTAAIKQNKIERKLGGEEPELTEIRCFSDDRIKHLKQMLETAELKNEKVVIWANYHQEFVDLEKLLGNRARYINRGCLVATKEAYIHEFKTSSLQYLVCHPQSVGMGLNFTEAHHAIYYSLNDSWEALKQSSERIAGHISVQPNKCIYHVMLAEGTVNELIYSNLCNKRESSFGLLEHLQAEALV